MHQAFGMGRIAGNAVPGSVEPCSGFCFVSEQPSCRTEGVGSSDRGNGKTQSTKDSVRATQGVSRNEVAFDADFRIGALVTSIGPPGGEGEVEAGR